ncbi:hypothetical protein FOCG_15230 [Fusarium oxysporum f. sp. radicis-lycopersici 26381]|uniref:Uncharacterized protein n=1 Tax=Fusarium oxysporum Fo47 TaxID=660027 RepID=W9JTV8_FUSOX|nr:hypothetical protein FOZG_13644 [Fusarium oxysporum Fo47]EXL42784.1 hypothetical protein FOCG_15230 [Fusarium oxysporum f. sp. radicis-lycopersici 26381]
MALTNRHLLCVDQIAELSSQKQSGSSFVVGGDGELLEL